MGSFPSLNPRCLIWKTGSGISLCSLLSLWGDPGAPCCQMGTSGGVLEGEEASLREGLRLAGSQRGKVHCLGECRRVALSASPAQRSWGGALGTRSQMS